MGYCKRPGTRRPVTVYLDVATGAAGAAGKVPRAVSIDCPLLSGTVLMPILMLILILGWSPQAGAESPAKTIPAAVTWNRFIIPSTSLTTTVRSPRFIGLGIVRHVCWYSARSDGWNWTCTAVLNRNRRLPPSSLAASASWAD